MLFCHPDSGWSRDQPQPGSFFQRPREAEKRDPGNEVGLTLMLMSKCEPALYKHKHKPTYAEAVGGR